MTLTSAQQKVLAHLRAAYAGPEGGPDEVVFNGRPNLQYTVGMLYPPEASSDSEATSNSLDNEVDADVVEGEVEEVGASVPVAEDWRPSSVAVSFVVDGASVVCSF